MHDFVSAALALSMYLKPMFAGRSNGATGSTPLLKMMVLGTFSTTMS